LLRERTGASTIEGYFATGARYAELVERLLERAGRPLATCRALLDFGCGAGRTLQHLQDAEGLELFGCDIHAPSVAWLRRNMPDVHAEVSPFRPPLAFGDDRFDCVYAWSVFSHLDQATQRQWLPELARILAPGGILLVSVFSEASELAASLYAPSLDLARVEREGVVFVPYPEAPDGARQAEFIPTDEPYGLTFVSREYLRAEWSRSLEVTDIAPLALEGMQDVVVLLHRD
jgi:SAM-dependent methyltransferase